VEVETSKNFDLPLQRKMGELFEQMRRISFFSWFVCLFFLKNSRKESKLSCSDKESMPKTTCTHVNNKDKIVSTAIPSKPEHAGPVRARVNPAPTTAPVGHSVHPLGCIFSSASSPCVNQHYHS
jgi:hypothetical protein